MDQDELRIVEEKCIQEHAPACTAICPIHVDARGICKEIAEQNYSAGLKIYRKTVPFPGILSHVCDEPCQQNCLRKDIGGSINLLGLERTLFEFGGTMEAPRPFPTKPKKVAVIGAGISGLTVAYDLARKGYQVVVFEKEPILGGILNSIDPRILSATTISNDFEILKSLKVDLRTSSEVKEITQNDQNKFMIHEEVFESLYIGIGEKGVVPEPFHLDSEQIVDPVTFQTSIPGVFAGGSLVRSTPVKIDRGCYALSHSIIDAMALGRSAALSMDRYLQKVSLSAARKNEGPYTTRLYTNIQRYTYEEETPAVHPEKGYSQTEASKEAKRCIQCECMECVKECIFLQEFGSYPKRYVREIYNNLSIVQGTRQKNRMINSCSLCGLCGEICPEDLNMADVCIEARRMMVSQNRMPPSAHDFALRDMAFSNSEKFSMVKHQPGTQASSVLFFPGCQLCASSPDDITNLYSLLCQNHVSDDGKGVGIALGCCGAPAEWAGQEILFKETCQRFLRIYQDMNCPLLLVACSSCMQIFKKYYPDIKIQSVWVYLNECNLKLPDLTHQDITISIQDPCTTRYERDIQDSIRDLLKKMRVKIQELPLSRELTECCSYGGLMWLANRDLAKRVVQRRIEQSDYDYLTYCAMCRDFFVKSGKQSLHIVDLIFHPDSIQQRKLNPSPDFSMRHENRARLKKKLLKSLWSERTMRPEPYENIKLIISEELNKMMEERMILMEDVQQVIHYAENTQTKLKNEKTGNFLAHFSPECVTYWVEYRPQENGFEIISAYCHRMSIEDEGRK